MSNFFKRFISSLLAVLTIVSLVPLEALNTYATHVGTGSGKETMSGGGDFLSSSTGYRLWLMGEDGQKVPDTNVVDLLNKEVLQTKQIFPTYNTKVEPWDGRLVNEKAWVHCLFSELVSTNFSSPLPRPVIENPAYNFVGQGDEFRRWLTNGEAIIQASGSSSGSGNITYRPVTQRPSTNTGGTGTGGTGNTGNTGTPSTEEDPSSVEMRYCSDVIQRLYNSIQSKANQLIAAKTQYTYTQAKGSLKSYIDRIAPSYEKLITDKGYSNYGIRRNLAGWQPEVFLKAGIGWKDEIQVTGTSKGGTEQRLNNSNNIINEIVDTAYATETTNPITVQSDGTLIINMFDIAYGSEATGEGETALEAKGNIYPLLNDNPTLFGLENAKSLTLADSVINTIANNNLKLVIEPIVWFQPAKITYSGGDYYLGTSPEWRFYGTPTTYASLMEYCKKNKGWYDGGTGGSYYSMGRGGWYSKAMNTVTATCLYLNGDLKLPDDEGEVYINKVSPSKEIVNSTLSRSDLGYAMHYVRFKGDGIGIPRTHTYDWDPTPIKTPHPAPDPSPDKIPLVPGEPTEPGDPKVPDPPGYLNTTRTIHIVKVYDIIHDDGSLTHVSTHNRDNNPGTITVEHEEDYKCIGYFTSEDYYGEKVGTVTEDLPWVSFRNNPDITPNDQIFWETDYESVKEKKAKDVAGTVKIGIAADLEYDAEKDTREPNNGYYDTTLYVHLVKKVKIPETSTYDEPDNPPTGDPKEVPPHPAEDPTQPDPNDPETDPVEPGNPYCHYRIVKVYETLYPNDGNKIETDVVFVTCPTNPIVYIQDEGQNNPDPKNDPSYHLIEWEYGDEFEESRTSSWDEPGWDYIVQPVNPKRHGTTPDMVDLIDYADQEKTVTLYVRLRRTKYKDPPTRGKLNIEQSQISKAIHSNDENIGGRFADYKFDVSIGGWKKQHTYTYTVPVPQAYPDGNGGYYMGTRNDPRSGVCQLDMPGSDGDNEANFVFDEIGSQHKLEVKLGVHSKTDARVYGNGGSSGVSRQDAMQYTEIITSMEIADNHQKYVSDGKDARGAEYVTVLWRGGAQKADIPTLAKFKENDLKNRYGADSWDIPNAMLKNADRKSRKQRATAAQKDTLTFEFGFSRNHADWDEEVYASCLNMGAGLDNMVGCIDYDKSRKFQTYDGTSWTYKFEAAVAIQFYAGKNKSMAAEAPSKSNIKGKGGQHYVSFVYQGTEKVNFYPYIRMTYMLPDLDDAIGEEDNTYETGHPNPNVRYDTYVLAERESSILPSDALQIGWKHEKGDDNTLTLTSQQWSLHQKAISGSDGWQGRNQVLPGGAIYQLATAKDNPAIVQIITYNTIVDDKARNEYLTATGANPSSTAYTVDKAVEEVTDFVNQVKTVLDNLNVVQWVNKNVGAATAWPSNFTAGSGTVKLAGKGESLTALNESGRRVMTANLDDKYYLRGNTFTSSSGGVKGSLTDFTSGKIGDRTYEIRKNTGTTQDEQSNSGDLDVSNVTNLVTVYKVFTNTEGEVYFAKREKRLNHDEMENAKEAINSLITELKDINGDNLNNSTRICGKTTTYNQINAMIPDTGLKMADELTAFVRNLVKSVERNTGDDPTASWVGGVGESKWYNEAFDGYYMVRQQIDIETTFQYSPMRVATLDPALCPVNRGQSDLYTKAFLSQFCVDSKSDAKIAEGKPDHYIGEFRGEQILLPDMELMYQSKKFYIPNANVQDLN